MQISILKDMDIPKSWSEIPLDRFIPAYSILTSKLPEGEHPVTTDISLYATLLGEDEKTIASMKLPEFNELAKKLSWVHKMPSERLPFQFVMGGLKYRVFIFNHEMEIQQFADYMSLVTKKEPDDIISNIDNLMGCFCVPETEHPKTGKLGYWYRGYPREAEVFLKEMNVAMAYPWMLFFCNVQKRLLPAIRTYSLKEMKKIKKQMQKMIKDPVN